MGYWLADIFMFAVEVYFWGKERKQKPAEASEKPLPRIVGSVPYVPLKK